MCFPSAGARSILEDVRRVKVSANNSLCEIQFVQLLLETQWGPQFDSALIR